MSAEKWEEQKLEEVLECLIDYRGKTPTKTATGIPLVTAKIVKNGFVQKPDEYIAESDYESWMTRGFPEIGDVLLTTEAPLGEVAQLNIKRVALAQRIVTLRGKKKILDNGFLKYFLRSDVGQARLKARETGTTVTGIKQSELRQIMISLPKIETQRAIAATLSALDDKIELNNRINKTLEEMAQALFKRWFVDFEFPDENGQPYKSSGGEMEESELGPIPKGWRVYKLEQLIDSVSITHKFDKDSVIFLNTSDILDGMVLHHNYSSVQLLPGQAKKSIKKQDILFSEIRPANKRFAMIDFEADNYVVSTKLMVLRTKAHVHPAVIFGYLTSPEVLQLLQHLAESRSGTFPQITFSHIRSLRVTLPESYLLEQYTQLVCDTYRSIANNQRENQNITSIRDALLPKLMSGEIRVPIEEVTADV